MADTRTSNVHAGGGEGVVGSLQRLAIGNRRPSHAQIFFTVSNFQSTRTEVFQAERMRCR